MGQKSLKLEMREMGSDLPYSWFFSQLRDRWISKAKKNTIRRSSDLAKKFNVPPQRISQWATGTDKTRGNPPWWIVCSLLEELNLEIRVAADGVRLVRRRKLKEEVS